MATKRNSNGTFAAGTSGNPAGRPRRSDLEKKMLEEICLLAPQALDALKRLLEDDETPANTRLRAAEIVLERVCGKALASDRLEDYEDRIRFDGGSVTSEQLVDALFKATC